MGKFCNHSKDGTVRSLFLHCNCGGSSHLGEIVQGEGEEGGLSTILFFTKLELMPAELTLHGTIIHLYFEQVQALTLG
jgi:hypothetical protein